MNVQLGELEIAGHQRIDPGAIGPNALQAGDHLLLPPLVGRAAIAVGDPEQWRGRKLARTRAVHHGHGLPAGPAGVLQPHRRALVLGPARIPHRVYVHGERVTEPALHIARRQINQKCRQLPLPSAVSYGRPLHYRRGRPVPSQRRRTSYNRATK
jgi:hypothetical protein